VLDVYSPDLCRKKKVHLGLQISYVAARYVRLGYRLTFLSACKWLSCRSSVKLKDSRGLEKCLLVLILLTMGYVEFKLKGEAEGNAIYQNKTLEKWDR